MPINDKFPGADLVTRGLADLRAHHYSIEGLLVAIGAPRLRGLNFDLPALEQLPLRPEHLLYDLLASLEPQDAHGRYNALIRRLVSFERACEFAETHASTEF